MKKLFTPLFVLCGLVTFGQVGGSGNPIINSLRAKELYVNHATLGYHFPFSRGINGKFLGLQGDSLTWLSIPSDTGKVSTSGDIIYGNLLTTGWLKAKSGVFAVGHNLGISNAAENKSVQFALSGSQVGNDTYTLPTAYPTISNSVLISNTDGSMAWVAKPDFIDIQVFENSGTYTPIAYSKLIKVICIGGGGGGGSGRRGSSGTIRTGGAGGAGGAYSEKTISAALVTSDVTVTVGSAGTRGAEVTTDNTNGNAGTDGGESSFGSFLAASGGKGGLGGTATGSTGGQSGDYWNIEAGGSGASSDNTGGAGTNEGFTRQSASGGGSGGGITSSNVVSNGGDGAHSRYGTNNPLLGGDGGVLGSPNGVKGNSVVRENEWFGGSAGGGGASLEAVAGGSGGAGGSYGGAGGGGAASENGYSSGAGGDGAKGIVIVITYF